jgi:hypothetical protein
MLCLSLGAFFFFRWWLKRDLRRVMVAYIRTHGTSTAVIDDEESQRHNHTSRPRKGGEISGGGADRLPTGKANSKGNGKVMELVRNKANSGGRGQETKAEGGGGKKAASAEVIEMTCANGKGEGKEKGKDRGNNGRMKHWVETGPLQTTSARGGNDAPSNADLIGVIGEPQWYGSGK